MKGNFKILENPTFIVVQWRGKKWERGEISANLTKKHWWISRALVQPENLRGKGIGSKMMGLLKKTIKKQDCRIMVVFPGGYDFNIRKQKRFYRKNGFKSYKYGTLKLEV